MLRLSMPLAETAAALRSGQLDLNRFVEAACDRLEQVDGQLQAFLPEANRRERLLREARALQDRFPSPAARPPLYGVPVGVKDVFRADGFPTGAGSRLPPELFAGAEADCVSKLRAAGALILGKTVTTEFAYFEPGPTRNPHRLDHTPGGSSSGSAAAVAAGLCPLALGTQTIGSVIRPAAFCGVVGFKPSYGRIDPAGVIFIAPSLDHVGLFAQDTDGVRLAASVLCAGWKSGATGMNASPTLGVPEGAYLQQASPEALWAFEAQLDCLESAGYTIRKVPALDDIGDIMAQHVRLMAGEMAQVHADWFARYEALYRPRTAALIREGQRVTAAEMAQARDMQRALRQRLESAMRDAGIDVWVSPAALGAAPKGLDSTGSPAMSFPWTFAGLPNVTLPAGLDTDGLPLGLQCAARWMQDEALLAWAKGIAAAATSAED